MSASAFDDVSRVHIPATAVDDLKNLTLQAFLGQFVSELYLDFRSPDLTFDAVIRIILREAVAVNVTTTARPCRVDESSSYSFPFRTLALGPNTKGHMNRWLYEDPSPEKGSVSFRFPLSRSNWTARHLLDTLMGLAPTLPGGHLGNIMYFGPKDPARRPREMDRDAITQCMIRLHAADIVAWHFDAHIPHGKIRDLEQIAPNLAFNEIIGYTYCIKDGHEVARATPKPIELTIKHAGRHPARHLTHYGIVVLPYEGLVYVTNEPVPKLAPMPPESQTASGHGRTGNQDDGGLEKSLEQLKMYDTSLYSAVPNWGFGQEGEGQDQGYGYCSQEGWGYGQPKW